LAYNVVIALEGILQLEQLRWRESGAYSFGFAKGRLQEEGCCGGRCGTIGTNYFFFNLKLN
jgi:hypothetical protein